MLSWLKASASGTQKPSHFQKVNQYKKRAHLPLASFVFLKLHSNQFLMGPLGYETP